MSWLQYLQDSGLLVSAREIARSICQSIDPAGDNITQTIDDYPSIHDEGTKQKIDLLMQIISTEGHSLLEAMLNIPGSDDRQKLELLISQPEQEVCLIALKEQFSQIPDLPALWQEDWTKPKSNKDTAPTTGKGKVLHFKRSENPLKKELSAPAVPLTQKRLQILPTRAADAEQPQLATTENKHTANFSAIGATVVPVETKRAPALSDKPATGGPAVFGPVETKRAPALSDKPATGDPAVVGPAETKRVPAVPSAPAAMVKNKAGYPEVKGFRFLGEMACSSGEIINKVAEYRHERTNMLFVLVPAGTFSMGSPDNEKGRLANEGPQHAVAVPAFLISEHPVTQSVWLKVMETKPWKMLGLLPMKHVREGDHYPAVHVSWHDAKAFCHKTSLSLPSEAQWEYACRAGANTKYYWGKEMDNDYCWYWENAGDVQETYAHQVGQRKPNAFNLFDMIGNVWEWCEDTLHDNYKDAPTDGSAWVGSEYTLRINRGGAWNSWNNWCRCACRRSCEPQIKSDDLGFRLVKKLT